MKYFTTLKALAAASLALGTTTGNSAITIETVKVWDDGNPPDTMRMQDGTTGYGSVNYHYNIGKYEVMVGQYTAFLNAVAATDTNGLYNVAMGTDLNVAGITRSGQSGSYRYSVRGNGLMPITYVSFGDALRFANWLSNGQPTGAQSERTTEDGAYPMKDFRFDVPLRTNMLRNLKNPNTGKGVSWWVPSENEWYKAAYYQPAAQGGDTDSYWLYPTASNTLGGNTIGVADSANYFNAGYAQTHNGLPTRLTDGGAYGNNSASYYGTSDQGGNAREWNDAVTGSSRGQRGGSWKHVESNLRSSGRNTNDPTLENDVGGFRVASSVPEPTTAVLMVIGGGAYLFVRRKRATL